MIPCRHVKRSRTNTRPYSTVNRSAHNGRWYITGRRSFSTQTKASDKDDKDGVFVDISGLRGKQNQGTIVPLISVLMN